MGDDFDGWNEMRREGRARRRESLHNMVERFGLLDRVEFVNEGTVIVDGQFYYYCQSKKARVKGTQKIYQMRGFQHFIDTFIQRQA